MKHCQSNTLFSQSTTLFSESNTLFFGLELYFLQTVIANREYTDEAYALARSNKIRLINREQLVEMILKLNPGATPTPKAVKEALPAV
ncbi:restriction endonuclease [Paenibacillus sedimenti]|uniref:Restriction endonuclease n=1 Tax=Paenibacillus sedimenti TaxID=2770274 RepID=A0A926KRP9_9BACL|nr:restriction endonuclease [Paenibacillus sedimenti]MBD0382862.1 restriction endonuclease [Paenibacillus sedimenti]